MITDQMQITWWFKAQYNQLGYLSPYFYLRKGVGKGGAGGAEAPPDFNSCYFTAKEC